MVAARERNRKIVYFATGLSVGKKEILMGIRGSSTCGLTFDNCPVPEDNVLGELGKGFSYAMTILGKGNNDVRIRVR